MKKYLLLLCSLLLCSVASGDMMEMPVYPRTGGQIRQYYPDKIPYGATFYKDYIQHDYTSGTTQASLSADYSVGSKFATFTATRSATTPATYIDSNGVIQLVTTSNTPRFQGGYYDSTGFHSQKGLMIEGASTNRATYSSVLENAAWTKTNVTADNDDAGSSSPDGTATSARIVATAGNGTLTQAYTDAVAGVYTASCYIKRKTGTGVINLRANTVDAYTAITTSVLTTTWTRVSVSSTSLTNPTFDLQLVTDTDAVYIYGCQLEKNPYMTSIIPCPTTALIRNAEVLKYAIAGNRTANEETIVVKFAPNFADSVVANYPYITGTDTKDRVIAFNPATNVVSWFPNNTDSAGVGIGDIVGASWTANQSMIIGVSCSHTNPKIVGYYNGSSSGTPTNDDYTNPAWGTYWYLGNSFDGAQPGSFIIQKVAIWGRGLSSSENLDVKNLFNQ